jgi:hypothetical protein
MSPNKLNDQQLVLLSAAARHPQQVADVTSHLKGGAAKKLVSKLLRDGLVEEIPARGSLPAWRRDDDAGPLALRITARGLEAIGLAEPDASPSAEKPRQDRGDPARKRSSRRGADDDRKKSDAAPRPAKSASRGSKQDLVIEMLRRPPGTTIAAIMKATGWQQHSVRGFFAGVIRKRLGLALTSQKTDGERIYRVIADKRSKSKTKTSASVAA